MSESIEFSLLQAVIPALFELGRGLAQAAGGQPAGQPPRLLQRTTQINDGRLLRQVLGQMKLRFQEGGAGQAWGPPGAVELQVFDERGQPWFALGRDPHSQAYCVFTLDRQDGPPPPGFSPQDPTPALGSLAQQYAYFKSLQVLLHNGFQVQGQAEKQPDGSQVLVLQKLDSASQELHTVKLVLRPEEGAAALLTDSRRKDGAHGVCPDLEPLLQAAGFRDHQKWVSPAAQQARQADASRQAPRQEETSQAPARREKNQARGQA